MHSFFKRHSPLTHFRGYRQGTLAWNRLSTATLNFEFKRAADGLIRGNTVSCFFFLSEILKYHKSLRLLLNYFCEWYPLHISHGPSFSQIGKNLQNLEKLLHSKVSAESANDTPFLPSELNNVIRKYYCN